MVVVYSIQYEHGFVIKFTRSLDEAKRSVATIMTDGTQHWRQRCAVPLVQANISETATIAMPKTDKTENYSCGGRRGGTCTVGRKEIYHVHGVWWCLEIFRRLDVGRRPLLLLYLQPTHRSIYLILLYVLIYKEEENDDDEDDTNAFKVSWAIITNTHVTMVWCTISL